MGVFLNGFLKAQDTIPFLDPCFSYPTIHELYSWTEYPIDTMWHLDMCLGLAHTEWSSFYMRNNKIPYGSAIYGIAITSPQYDLPEGIVCKICTYDENNGFFYYDSIHSRGNHFVKHMFYDYHNTCFDHTFLNYTDTPVVPCHLYFFNEGVRIYDSVFYSSLESSIEPPVNYPYFLIFMAGTGFFCGTYPTCGYPAQSPWGLIFPILKLPCPALRVSVGTNFSGRVEFHWNPGGDTMLYQLAFHSADDGRLMFETDTLTDTTFTLVDSIAPAEMVNGRYEVRVRKACDYTGAPIANPLVWSDWSEPRTFNYMHRVEGIEDIESFGPQFTLSPNPAKGTVTVEGAAGVERVEIVDMEGRVVIGERPLAGSPSTVDISHLAPGVYLVRLSGPTGSATRKLVVE